ncbi:MAG: hypothetical protein L0Y79_10030 [Chlorobi bacterium]|nr:hypothetical protein [Chlorobiota bacterium]MCI0715207.1 hypothetical protein [Chlorobiota bacterium]
MEREFIICIRQLKNKKMVVEISNRVYSSPGLKDEKLVYYEVKKNIRAAMAREKRLKSLNRLKLVEVVKRGNPEMFDLRDTLSLDNINETNFQ